MVAALSQSRKYYVCFGAAFYSSCLTFLSSFENVCISPPLLPALRGFESSTWALAVLSTACKRDAGGVKWRAAKESEERAVRGTSEKEVQAAWRVKANLKITGISLDPVFH